MNEWLIGTNFYVTPSWTRIQTRGPKGNKNGLNRRGARRGNRKGGYRK